VQVLRFPPKEYRHGPREAGSGLGETLGEPERTVASKGSVKIGAFGPWRGNPAAWPLVAKRLGREVA